MKMFGTVLFLSGIYTSYSNNECMTKVESCPLTKQKWSERSEVYNCTERHYVCIMNKDGNLVEACMTEYTIMDGVGGCPFIRACSGNEPFLAENKKFKTCLSNDTGCPLASHGGYTVLQLYKYPACIGLTRRHDGANKNNNNNDGGHDNMGSGTIIAVAVCLGLVAVFCTIVIAVFIVRRKRQKEREKNKTVENDKTYPLLEVGERTKQNTDQAGNQVLGNKKVSKDMQDENTRQGHISVEEIVKAAIPLLKRNGILILVSNSKASLSTVAENLAMTFGRNDPAPGFKEFVKSFRSKSHSTNEVKCVLFDNCFQSTESGELLKLHDLRDTFDHLFDILRECEGRMKYIITVTKTLWNGRKKFLTSSRLFSEHYVMEF